MAPFVLRIACSAALVLAGCITVADSRYRFTRPLIAVSEERTAFWFSMEFLEMANPFSVLVNGQRFGVFVQDTNVSFRYPAGSVSDPTRVILIAYPDDPQDHAKIDLQRMTTGWYEFSLENEGGVYTASLNLPDGFYCYGGVDYRYNPCWWHDGPCAQSFFVVGKIAGQLEYQSRCVDLMWMHWKTDENPRPEIRQAPIRVVGWSRPKSLR